MSGDGNGGLTYLSLGIIHNRFIQKEKVEEKKTEDSYKRDKALCRVYNVVVQRLKIVLTVDRALFSLNG